MFILKQCNIAACNNCRVCCPALPTPTHKFVTLSLAPVLPPICPPPILYLLCNAVPVSVRTTASGFCSYTSIVQYVTFLVQLKIGLGFRNFVWHCRVTHP